MNEKTVSYVPAPLSIAPSFAIGRVHPIWRLRVITGAIVAAYMVGSFYLWPDPTRRAMNSYLFIVPFGYGHLIGGTWFARTKMRAMYPTSFSPRLFTAFLWIGMLNLFALYEWSIGVFGPSIVILFQAFSCWHILENDLGLRRAYDEKLKLKAVPRSFWYHLTPFGFMGLILIVAAALLPELQSVAAPSILFGRVVACGVGMLLVFRSGLSHKLFGVFLIGATFLLPSRHIGVDGGIHFADVFNPILLYHLVSWLVFFYDRGQKLPAPARRDMWKRIAVVHLPPVVVCVPLLVISIPALDIAREWVFSVAIYLFWSVAHVVQTFVVRGVEPRAVGATAGATK